MNNITVNRILELLDETEVQTEEDYIALVHKIKDWNERSKANKKAKSEAKESTKKKTPGLTEEDVNSIINSYCEEVNSEIERTNKELKEMNPAIQLEAATEKIKTATILRGNIFGANAVRSLLLTKITLKSSNTK